MSGECEKCGEHTTDCRCSKNDGLPESCSRMIAFEEMMEELEDRLEEENEEKSQTAKKQHRKSKKLDILLEN